MKAWFANLQPRERLIVVIGGIAALLIVAWMAVVSPLLTESAALRASVTRKQRLLLDLGRVAGMQQSRSPQATDRPQPTLYVLVDSTAKEHGLQLPRTRQEGADGVNVTLQNAPADALLDWLANLEVAHSVRVESASISPAREQGRVNGQVFLRR
ncbi:MAG TPA: type II secretion system protein M [Gammaproteobacteria bacterium]|nr:type II secretion system protein M [Gammaproteobacteria bacterium]